jgi:hypothetical protein
VGRNGKCFLVGTMLSVCSFCVEFVFVLGSFCFERPTMS